MVIDSDTNPPDRPVVVSYVADDGNQGLQTVDHLNHLRDPLYYPVIFSTGCENVRGWSSDLKLTNRKRMSPKDFYFYRLHERFEEY